MVAAIRTGLLRLSCTEACEEHDEHAEEEQKHRYEAGPHASGVVSVRDVVAVDVIFDDLSPLVSCANCHKITVIKKV